MSQHENHRRKIALGVGLILLSAAGYSTHYALFRDAHHIFIFLVGDLAFVFLEVLLVTLVIHQALETREARARREKLNVVIGIFFSKAGPDLIRVLTGFDVDRKEDRRRLLVHRRDALLRMLENPNLVEH